MQINLKLLSKPSSSAKFEDRLMVEAANKFAEGLYEKLKRAKSLKCDNHPMASNRVDVVAVKGKPPKTSESYCCEDFAKVFMKKIG